MAKDLLNEAERYLLNNWYDARMLEEAMEGVRKKYSEVFERIREAVTAKYRDLDEAKIFVTQFWSTGIAGFTCSRWPDSDTLDAPGLWLDNLRLENLSAESEPPPEAILWIAPKTARKFKLDMTRARNDIAAAAKQLLEREEAKALNQPAEEDVLLSFPAPSKAELLQAFLASDGHRFVDRMLAQVDLMAKFIPVLNAFFVEAK